MEIASIQCNCNNHLRDTLSLTPGWPENMKSNWYMRSAGRERWL